MTQNHLPSIADLRKAYSQGVNITHLLSQVEPSLDREEIIEIAYDMQSGSYVEIAAKEPDRLKDYASELFGLLKSHVNPNDIILDCGAGELTTLSALSHHLPSGSELLACDISLSRLRVGRRFASQAMKTELARGLRLFVADMAFMPLASNSVDVVLTVHALEPNHGREEELIRELLRISSRKLVLFEPSWENASKKVQQRMHKHGYVRDLPLHIANAGGDLISVNPLPNPVSPLNPTFCYVVEKSDEQRLEGSIGTNFTCPRSGLALSKENSYWWSEEGGWAYPIIDGVSCLRKKHGILMSHA